MINNKYQLGKKENLVSNKITMMSEQFESGETGQSVEGITIIIDGVLKQFLDIIKTNKPEYENNLSLIQDALMKGLNIIKDE